MVVVVVVAAVAAALFPVAPTVEIFVVSDSVHVEGLGPLEGATLATPWPIKVAGKALRTEIAPTRFRRASVHLLLLLSLAAILLLLLLVVVVLLLLHHHLLLLLILVHVT